MNLIPSMITSFCIIAVIWGIALLQPNAALAHSTHTVPVTSDDADLFIKDTFMATSMANSERKTQAAMLAVQTSKKQDVVQTQQGRDLTGQSSSGLLLGQHAQSQPPQSQRPQPQLRASSPSEAIEPHLISMAGNTKRLVLTELDSLWQTFNHNRELTASLLRTPSKVYVYYRAFSASYDSALVTIGYDHRELEQQIPVLSINKSQFEPILNQGGYDNATLVMAWQKFDYSRGPTSVLEVHYLLPDGSTEFSELLVSYQ